ncbi:MAG: tetratricopeptide repeat protein [Hyphomicrobiaceae bacterium]
MASIHGIKVIRSAAATLCLVLAMLAPARAETAFDCFSENKDLWIPGCTALIERPGVEPEQLSSAYAMRALGYSLKGQYDTAIADYDAAIRINPDFAVALNNRAWAYFRSGHPQKGLPDVEKSLKLNPLSEHSWDTRAHIRQAGGNATGAFDDYEKAVQIGGERMIRLYQCGLKENGLYNGPVDGLYTTDVRSALRTCSKTTTCDPLPGDEQCRAATS